jgi:type IV secretory pathway ATPase VirB11/archaellum biosynthesis ATPase
VDNGKACFEYDVFHEAENKIIKVYLGKCNFPPSVEYSALCMGKTIEVLMKNTGVTHLILTQLREYEYDYSQVSILNELAMLYKKITIEERKNHSNVVTNPLYERYIRSSYTKFQGIISKKLKEDPFGAFVELKRLERAEKVKQKNLIDERHIQAQHFFVNILDDIILKISKLKLISLLMPHSSEYKLGDRLIYSYVFSPTTKPDFMYTKLITTFPDGNIESSYNFKSGEDDVEVNIFSFDDNVKTLYHINPPEFKFKEEIYELLDDAKRIMAEHKPTREEFVDPKRMREVFFSIGKDLLTDLIEHKKMDISEEKINQLAHALLRYTVGFGLIELLLADPKVQDVNINAPNGELPIFIVHQDFGDCYTNVFPTKMEVDSWATKLRLISGRPLDEANPILDTELEVETFTARVSAITAPLSPLGMGFSFRRHRDHPWTFPLYMKNRYINQVSSGLLSFIIENNATILIAGTRSSGKSSLLGSVLTEMSRRSRIITIEDTFELPQNSLRTLGYNIEPLKVASALSSPGSEVDPSIGIRSTLRLGDSAIFVGEVRSKEAIALFEAMRVGAAANVVAGTIHADSPYGVYDRVVNDIGVPKTSFKAIDIIVVTNPVISGLKKYKRVLRITEVRKLWEDDPLNEGAFVDLMVYNPDSDQLEITDDLINGNSEILKRMAGKVKEFSGDWDSVWDNIELRGKCKNAIVEISDKYKDNDLLEAEFVILCNDQLRLISDRVRGKYGKLDSKRIFFEYNDWLDREVRKRELRKMQE